MKYLKHNKRTFYNSSLLRKYEKLQGDVETKKNKPLTTVSRKFPNILQGSAATRFRCDEILIDGLTTNALLIYDFTMHEF